MRKTAIIIFLLLLFPFSISADECSNSDKERLQKLEMSFKEMQSSGRYTQEQLAGMLGVTVKTYRSWEQDTLPKTIDLINLSIILGCDIDYLLGRINTDTHFKAYIDRTYALSQQSFDKLSLLHFFLTEKNNNMHKEIAVDVKSNISCCLVIDNPNGIWIKIRVKIPIIPPFLCSIIRPSCESIGSVCIIEFPAVTSNSDDRINPVDWISDNFIFAENNLE